MFRGLCSGGAIAVLVGSNKDFGYRVFLGPILMYDD